MGLPTRPELESAAARIGDHVRRTPTLTVHGDELGLAARVVLKLELTQHTGSFKARGALNAVLSLPPEATGVWAASGGNHGAALAWSAAQAGVAADVFVPSTSPEEKRERIASFGGTVHDVEGHYPQAAEAALAWAAGSDAVPVHAYDDRAVVCGASTVGLELAQQVPDADRVLVACGGGGLFAGTALALRDVVPVVPVEPERCTNLAAALDAGEPVPVEVGGVAADSLGSSTIGRHAFDVATELGVAPVAVPDEAIVEARRWLWQRCRVLAEPGAATPLAALMTGAVLVRPGEVVVVVVSGGNNPAVP